MGKAQLAEPNEMGKKNGHETILMLGRASIIITNRWSGCIKMLAETD